MLPIIIPAAALLAILVTKQNKKTSRRFCFNNKLPSGEDLVFRARRQNKSIVALEICDVDQGMLRVFNNFCSAYSDSAEFVVRNMAASPDYVTGMCSNTQANIVVVDFSPTEGVAMQTFPYLREDTRPWADAIAHAVDQLTHPENMGPRMFGPIGNG